MRVIRREWYKKFILLEGHKIVPMGIDFSLKGSELEKELRKHGIGMTVEEARSIEEILGRVPTMPELFSYDVQWSEHCSYKSSKATLKEFFHTEGPNVIMGPGEDSGIVKLGGGWGIVASHESHNHPSQLLPVEGAATGIGGIIRDVCCMGAKVVACADPLRFGNPDGEYGEKVKWVSNGVVDGIWQYGNAIGVPTIAGDVYFDSTYDHNCLVNVVSLGVIREEDIIHSYAPKGAAGYDVILVGKPTDNSGFGGVTFASEELGEDSEERKGAVQIPDPFLEEVLLEATLDTLKKAKERGLEVGFKDLGGGGLNCAGSEIGSAGGYGIEIDLDKVHVGLDDLKPEEILCAETQERFLWVVPKEFTKDVLKIYNEDWDLPNVYERARASVIGEVCEHDRFVVKWEGDVVVDVPIKHVTGGITYEREEKEAKKKLSEPKFEMPDLKESLLGLLGRPNIASKLPVFRYYDTEVQGNTIVKPGEGDAGVIHPVKDQKAIALSVDGNGRYGRISPYWGGVNATAEAMRNVAAVGAVPWALTDCLNFGNPEKPESFWEFREGVRGVSEAAKGIKLKGEGVPVPIISGNVSFYNEADQSGKAIDPTPVVACIGLVDAKKAVTMSLKEEESVLVLVGGRKDELGGSEYYSMLGHLGKNVPQPDFEAVKNQIYGLTDAVEQGLVLAAHDISDGGLGVCVAEMIMGGYGFGKIGAEISIDGFELREDKILFSETGGFVLEARETDLEKLKNAFGKYDMEINIMGKTGGRGFKVIKDGKTVLTSTIPEMAEKWLNGAGEALK